VKALRLAAVALVVVGAVCIGGTPASAGVGEGIRNHEVEIEIEPSGDLLITETIDYDFGDAAFDRHGIFRNIPVRFNYEPKENTDRVYDLEVVSVEGSEGTPDQYVTSEVTKRALVAGAEDVGYVEIKIGDPDTTIEGEHTYEIVYRVKGALNGFEDHDELYWNAIGDEWPLIIDRAVATVQAPADITAIRCFQGSYGSNAECEGSSSVGPTATFSETDLFPFNAMTVVIALPKGVVPNPKPILEERWTVEKAFEVTPVTGGVAGGLLLLGVGGYVLAFQRFGRDRRFKGGPVDQAFGTTDGADEATPLISGDTETPVEFVPPDDLRPGQVGTLVDFHANPLDVTATIIDLAVRKYLVIEEVETESRWLKNDWKLTKLKEPDDELKDYEKTLLQGLFQGRGNEVELSDLKEKFANRMRKVQTALDNDAKAQRWFVKDPSQACMSVGCLGMFLLIAGVVATGLLAAFTSLGLLGIPIVVLGIVVMFSGVWAPARSAKGSAVLRRVNGFRRFIEESEKERAKFAEKKNLFSEYLPYAIVFGAVDKWARAFSGLDGEPPDTSYWYHSSTPFEYTAFSSSINGFTTTTAGTLTSSPPSTSGSSGFSGGGSSGGGGGGGGGGSW
jgi:uncharacterized membrane protein YgcG